MALKKVKGISHSGNKELHTARGSTESTQSSGGARTRRALSGWHRPGAHKSMLRATPIGMEHPERTWSQPRVPDPAMRNG